MLMDLACCHLCVHGCLMHFFVFLIDIACYSFVLFCSFCVYLLPQHLVHAQMMGNKGEKWVGKCFVVFLLRSKRQLCCKYNVAIYNVVT